MAINLLIKHNSDTFKFNLGYKTIIIGRSSKVDITLQDKKISGKHCSFTLTKDGDIFLEDLASTNGTYVNGSTQNRSRIFVGDVISIGSAIIQIDGAALNPKERKNLVNTDRTSVRFINPPSDNSVEHNFTSPKGLEVPPKKISNDEISINFNSRSIQTPRKESINPEPVTSSASASSSHNFQIDDEQPQSKESQNEDVPNVKEMIDSGYVSSGQTKMIKLDKEGLKVQMEKSKKIKSKTKIRKPKREKKKKPKTFLEKIFAFFN